MPVDEISTSVEEWTLTEIRNIKRTIHNTYNPRKPDLPIVAIQGLTKFYLLDGNRRVNTWIRDNNEGPHKVRVITWKRNASS